MYLESAEAQDLLESSWCLVTRELSGDGRWIQALRDVLGGRKDGDDSRKRNGVSLGKVVGVWSLRNCGLIVIGSRHLKK